LQIGTIYRSLCTEKKQQEATMAKGQIRSTKEAKKPKKEKPKKDPASLAKSQSSMGTGMKK
jgi:hypothetical protein